jgi:very-short-patch-repair endonuclease
MSNYARRRSKAREEKYPIIQTYAEKHPRMTLDGSSKYATNQSGYSRLAQSNGNIITTPPGFYSPYHTPSAWQIPTNRREVYAWCSYFYENEPIVATGIDFYSMFSMNGFELECPSNDAKQFFEDVCDDLHLDKWLPLIAREYFLYGDVFVMTELSCVHCEGTGYDEHENICKHESAKWSKLYILDPNTIEVTPSIAGEESEIRWIPPETVVKVVQTKQPEYIYNKIPDYTKQLILAKRPIVLDRLCVSHLKSFSSPYQTFGISLIRRLFPTLAYRDKLRQAQWLVAERHALPIKVVKIGSDSRPASEEDIQAVQEQMAAVANDPVQTIVSHNNFDLDWIGASGKVLQLTQEYELINEDLQTGLQLNKALLHGEGPNYSSAQVGLDALSSKLESFRQMVADWLRDKIFKPIAIYNNITTTDARGITKIIYPKVKFHDLSLRDKTPRLQAYMQLRNRNELSLKTILEELGIDYDTEIEQIREEETGAVIGDIANGFGAQEGADLGGMGGGMGMSPDLGGGMGMPPEGTEMPMPPMEGGGIPGGAETSMASNNLQNYKNGLSVLSKFSDNVISGNGKRGNMPEKLAMPITSEWTINGKDITVEEIISIQNAAILRKNAAKGNETAADMPKKVFYTEIESLLFGGLKKINLPPALFAQYIVGGNPKFRVDAAYPTVKVAIEADGETWHNNPEAIERDRARDSVLMANGWIVLRFTEDEIRKQLPEVIEVIRSVVLERYSL